MRFYFRRWDTYKPELKCFIEGLNKNDVICWGKINHYHIVFKMDLKKHFFLIKILHTKDETKDSVYKLKFRNWKEKEVIKKDLIKLLKNAKQLRNIDMMKIVLSQISK